MFYFWYHKVATSNLPCNIAQKYFLKSFSKKLNKNYDLNIFFNVGLNSLKIGVVMVAYFRFTRNLKGQYFLLY